MFLLQLRFLFSQRLLDEAVLLMVKKPGQPNRKHYSSYDNQKCQNYGGIIDERISPPGEFEELRESKQHKWEVNAVYDIVEVIPLKPSSHTFQKFHTLALSLLIPSPIRMVFTLVPHLVAPFATGHFFSYKLKTLNKEKNCWGSGDYGKRRSCIVEKVDVGDNDSKLFGGVGWVVRGGTASEDLGKEEVVGDSESKKEVVKVWRVVDCQEQYHEQQLVRVNDQIA